MTADRPVSTFRMWGKLIKNNKLMEDFVSEIPDISMSRTAKVFHALEEITVKLDLGSPIWLDSNIHEFQRRDKTRFYQDNFIEQIDFDYLEIQIIEE